MPVRRVVFLVGVAGPRALDHARAELAGEFHSAVGGSAIDDQDFIGAAKAFDGARQVALFVQSDDRSGNLHEPGVMSQAE